MDLYSETMKIAAAFDYRGLPYAICGGVALAIHGFPRATKDIDILIQPADLNRAQEILVELGYDLEAGLLPFDLGTPKERRVFRTSKVDQTTVLTIDLLMVSEIFAETWQQREAFALAGQRLHVVSRAGLIQMKTVAGRLQDLADIEALLGEKNDQ
jgi:hypothetical protein